MDPYTLRCSSFFLTLHKGSLLLESLINTINLIQRRIFVRNDSCNCGLLFRSLSRLNILFRRWVVISLFNLFILRQVGLVFDRIIIYRWECWQVLGEGGLDEE